MNKTRNLTLAIAALMLAILACNLPAQKPGTDATPTFTSAPPQTATTTAPTVVPTSSTPTVTVSAATNCRTGPDPSYSLVLTFQPGATAQVVGKYSPSNYWVINTPTGGTCWLWGQYATVQGNTSILAEIAPPPLPPTQVAAVPPTKAPTAPPASPTKSIIAIGPVINPGIIKIILPPAAPSNFIVTTNCQFIYFPVKVLTSRSDSLSWAGVSNATGYSDYINGSLHASLPASDTNPTIFESGSALIEGAIQFGVTAQNAYGTSAMTSTTSHCP